MLNVYDITVREDKEKEKYNVENLIRFDKNGLAVHPFNLWFDCSHSKLWKPKLQPPVILKEMVSSNVEEETTLTETNADFDHQVNSKSSSILENFENDVPKITPLLKKYLNKDVSDDTKSSSTKWHSPLTNVKKSLKKSELCEEEPNVVKKLKQRGKCFVSFNCRGKWVIHASSMINGHTLEDLWSRLSDEFHQGLFDKCNITFQSDPDRVLIYTNFLSSTMVGKVFTSVREMVQKMSYVVHPHGQVLCWNSGEITIM